MQKPILIIATQGLIALDVIALKSYAGQPLAILWAFLALVAGGLMLALIKSDISEK